MSYKENWPAESRTSMDGDVDGEAADTQFTPSSPIPIQKRHGGQSGSTSRKQISSSESPEPHWMKQLQAQTEYYNKKIRHFRLARKDFCTRNRIAYYSPSLPTSFSPTPPLSSPFQSGSQSYGGSRGNGRVHNPAKTPWMQNSGKSKAQFQPHNLQARQKNQRMRPQISPEAQQHSPDFLAPQKQQRYRAVRPGSAPTTGDMAPIYNKSWSPESPGCAPEAFECLKGISQKVRRGTSNLRSGVNRPEPSSGFGNMQFENEASKSGLPTKTRWRADKRTTMDNAPAKSQFIPSDPIPIQDPHDDSISPTPPSWPYNHAAERMAFYSKVGLYGSSLTTLNSAQLSDSVESL